MEFDFREMSDNDYHGVKSLLSQVATGPLADLTTLADTIVNQVNIGTTVSTGDDSALCAFGTVLNMTQHKNVPGMSSVFALLKDVAKKNPKAAKPVSNMLGGNPEWVTGLVLKERLINFPDELAHNIHRVLIDDVQWSGSDEYEPDEGEKREDFQFTHAVFLSSFEIESGSRGVAAEPVEGEESQPAIEGVGHKKKRKMDKKAAAASRVYLHWEDEILSQKALFSHSWQNSAKPVVLRANRKYQSYNFMYALRWSDYEDLVAQLSALT